MADGEPGSSSHESQTALLAAFVTLVVATGSAFVWRSSAAKPPTSALLSSATSARFSPPTTPDLTHETSYVQPIHARLPSEEAGTSDMVKQARSKERRRRGKDPLKEMLKAERKGKANAKFVATSHIVTLDAGPSKQPLSGSDRSRSVSTASSSRAPPPEFKPEASSFTSKDEEEETKETDEEASQHESVSASTSTSVSHASTGTADTSPQSSIILTPEQPTPSASEPGPWDWDGNSTTYNSIPVESTSTGASQPSMKPPRFRSHSRQPDSNSSSSSSLPSPDTPSFPTLNGGIRTPKRTPTPSGSVSDTPPPSLSLHTQLASLRGALEATRLREEKTRKEMERLQKESEMFKWESRRREAELQAQIHALMHQVQAYSMYSSGAFSPISAPTPPLPGMYPTSTPASPSYHPWPVPPPSIVSPSGTSSSSPVPPFFIPSGIQSPRQLYPSGIPPPLYSTSGSPSPSPSSRGRRRARPMDDDGWVLASSSNLKGEPMTDSPPRMSGNEHDGLEGPDQGEEAEEQVNDVLLDAIMKRPESMRSNSLKAKASSNNIRRPPLEELTFPSIADSMVVYSTESQEREDRN